MLVDGTKCDLWKWENSRMCRRNNSIIIKYQKADIRILFCFIFPLRKRIWVKTTPIFMATNGLVPSFWHINPWATFYMWSIYFIFFIFLFGLLRPNTGILSRLKHQSICKTESMLPQRYWPYHKRYIMSCPSYQASYNRHTVSPLTSHAKWLLTFCVQ